MKKVARLLARGELDRERADRARAGRASRTTCRKARRSTRSCCSSSGSGGASRSSSTNTATCRASSRSRTCSRKSSASSPPSTSILHKDVHRERTRQLRRERAASVRTLNRKMGWTLPTTGPRTLNGLIVEYLETIPEPGTKLRIGDYSLEMLQIDGQRREDGAAEPGRGLRSADCNSGDAHLFRADIGERRPRDASSSASCSRLTPSTWMPSTCAPCRGTFARGTSARCEALLRGLAQALLAERHRADLAGEPEFAEARPCPPRAARSRRLDRTASTAGRSAAVSPMRTPPTTLTNTSCPRVATPPCRCSTASSSARRLRFEAHRDAPRIHAPARRRRAPAPRQHRAACLRARP